MGVGYIFPLTENPLGAISILILILGIIASGIWSTVSRLSQRSTDSSMMHTEASVAAKVSQWKNKVSELEHLKAELFKEILQTP